MTNYERYLAACARSGKPTLSQDEYEKVRAEAIERSNEQTRRSNEACRNATHADIYGGDTDAHYD